MTAAGQEQARSSTPTAHTGHANPPALTDSIDAACFQLRESWLNGERLQAETFIANLSKELRTNDCAIELVCTEILVRRQLGETIVLDEYRQRFPDLAATLEMQLELYDALLPVQWPSSFDDAAIATVTPPHIEGYQLTQLLGQGATGVVYQAWHTRLQRFVALKVLRSEGMTDEHARARFRVEAHAVAHLQHPGIVQLYEVGIGAPAYLVMELVDGGTLAQKLAGGPLAPARATNLLATLARAIQHAHDRGVLHRDLKPANVLLTSSGDPKLTDFGLAKRLDVEQEQTRTGTILGTPGYMAPEQASGRVHDIGTTSDVYSLGAILYHCLTGMPPFHGATAMETLLQVIEQDPASPHDLNRQVPRDLATICLKCLEKNPQRRYSSAADLADDLIRFREGIPIHARPVGVIERAVKWNRRHPTKSLLAVSICAFIVALTAGGMFVSKQNQARINGARAALSGTLKRAADLRDRQQWAAAEELLQQSQPLLKDAESPSLALQISDELALVRLASDLEHVRFRREIPGESVIGLDATGVIDSYDRLFKGAHWDLSRPNRSIAAQFQASPIRDEIIAALDDWAFAANEADKLEQCQQLLNLVREIDRDPWRDEVRNFKYWNDRQHLERLGNDVKGNEPLSLIAFLATLMNQAGADAEPLLRRAYQSHPDHPDINWQLGTVQFKKRQHVQAAGFFRAVLAARPRNSSAFGRLGDSLEAIGQLDEAIAAYKSAIEIEPKSGWFFVNLGNTYRKKGLHDAELAAYRQAVAVDPVGHIGRENLGMALINHGELEEAVEQFRLALDPRRKDSAIAYNGLGLALAHQNRIDAAIAALRAGIEVNPSFAALHINLANQLYSQDKLEEAAQEFRRTIELEPRGALAYVTLVPLLTILGQYSEAREFAKKGCSLVARSDPQYAVLQEHLKSCEHSILIQDSLAFYLKTRNASVSNIQRIWLGHFCFLQKHDYKLAMHFFKEAFNSEPVMALDIRTHNRHYAACSAILWTLDAADLPDPERSANLKQAWQWLRADLDELVARAAKPNYDQAQLTEMLNQRLEERALKRVWHLENSDVHPGDQAAWNQLKADLLELASRVPRWWLDKGRQHAERKEWSDSAHCYTRAFALDESALPDTWFEFAAVQVLAGDLKAYEAVCDRFSKRARSHQLRPYHVARAITLCPAARDSFAEPARFAEKELATFNNHFWSLTEQGALAYRLGDIPKAQTCLQRSLDVDPRPGRAVLNWLWLALASHEYGDAKQAQAWLHKSRRWLSAWNDGLPGREDESQGTHFHNYLEAQILLREAIQRIEATPVRN